MANPAYTAVPATRPFKVPRKLKIIVGVMVVCAAAGLLGLAAAAKKKTAAAPPGRYAGFATLVANNYLAGTPLDVPTAQGLDSTLGRLSQAAAGDASVRQPDVNTVAMGASRAVFESAVDQTVKGVGLVETDTFLVEYKNGSVGRLAVVVDGTANGPELGALPSLLPPSQPPPANPPVATGVPVGQLTSSLPGGVQFQVDQWATDYAANNETGLYTLTGDTANRTYRGLGGFQVVGNPVIVSSTEPEANHRLASRLVVTITVTFQSTATSTVVTSASYDLLLENLQDHLPNIVAWGPAGSGAALAPFENGR